VGDELGISRERVRQIFKKETKKDWGAVKRARKRWEEEKRLDSVAFSCRQCKTDMTYRDKKGRRVFCSRKCHTEYYERDRTVTNTCEKCSKEFHPYRYLGSKSQRYVGRFCSHECYLTTWRSKKD